MLDANGSFDIHDHNLQKLVTEAFTIKMNLPPKTMNGIFDIVEYIHYFRNRDLRPQTFAL